MGNGGSRQFIMHCLCCSFLLTGRTPHTLLLLQHGVPPTGDSPPQNSPVWVLPMGCSFSLTAPAWVTSIGCSPSGTDCLSVGPPRGHKSCQQTCSSVGFPWGHSLLWASTCPSVESSMGCRWVSAPLWTSMDCMGTASFTMVCTTGCRGTSALVHLLPLLQ